MKLGGGDTVGYLVEGEEKVITRGPNKDKKRIVPKKGGSLMYTLRTLTHHFLFAQIVDPECLSLWMATQGTTFLELINSGIR